MKQLGTLRTGTSNIVIPGTKNDFPEEFRTGSRLHYYASLFNSLEVNSTFYKLPSPRTFEKWAADVPDDFTFTLKLWQDITHVKKLEYNPSDLESFFQAADHVGSKKGCLLIQFPPGVTFQYVPKVEDLLQRLHALNNPEVWKLCIEFRHSSWYENESAHTILARYNTSMVLHDMPASKTPWIEKSLDVVYLRFHGPKGDYRGSYAPEVLQAHAQNIQAWLRQGKDVYAYFNNTIGDAFDNARLLQATASF